MGNPDNLKGAHGMRDALIVSRECQAWAKDNGHATELESTQRLLADWRSYRQENGKQLSIARKSPEEKRRLLEKYKALADLYEKAL